MGFFDRLKAGLSRTTQQLVERFDEIVRVADTPERRVRPIDVDTLDALEELLIGADLGVAATDRILNAVSARARHGESLRDLVREEILTIFKDAQRPVPPGEPHVTLVVGVNGTGKTTTVGKLASLARSQGQKPLICAADTFRAAAVDQLQIWAQRAEVEIIRAKEGSDPAAVVFDAVSAGKARHRSPILVDTAGRLHTQSNLMEELAKVRRVITQRLPDAPHETLLVVDATTGQNGLQQARLFGETAGVTGVALTKLDGSAKGGVAIPIAYELGLPVKLIGVGEQLDDLRPFDANDFARALVSG